MRDFKDPLLINKLSNGSMSPTPSDKYSLTYGYSLYSYLRYLPVDDRCVYSYLDEWHVICDTKPIYALLAGPHEVFSHFNIPAQRPPPEAAT